MDRNVMGLAALAAAGCVGARDAHQVYEEVVTDLGRLRALQVVEVGDLIADEPAADLSCYGLPCPGQPVAPEYAEQAERLRDVADAAEVAVEEAGDCAGVDPEVELGRLRALQIVEIGALILEQAEPDPNCYNLPCPDEQARVDEANCAQVGRLAAIAEAAADL